MKKTQTTSLFNSFIRGEITTMRKCMPLCIIALALALPATYVALSIFMGLNDRGSIRRDYKGIFIQTHGAYTAVRNVTGAQ
jgi:hypothetical protein